MNIIEGKAYKDKYTKLLVNKIGKGCIAVIRHWRLDITAAQELKHCSVKAIINCEMPSEGSGISEGMCYALKSGIGIYNVLNGSFFDVVNDGDIVKIDGNLIYINGRYCTNCIPVSFNAAKCEYSQSEKNSFMLNTIDHMRSELKFFLCNMDLPDIKLDMKNRDVLIISRGRGYIEDFTAVKSFVLDNNLIIVGVDGGANAVFDAGMACDIIIGDMDSVSDKSLKNCREILVHSYMDGYAPGVIRMEKLGIGYKLIRVIGTSEDAAILMCKQKGASTIYLVGGHIGIEEFMEKGRDGMGSTAILRMLYGSSIIDLKGISRLIKCPNI